MTLLSLVPDVKAITMMHFRRNCLTMALTRRSRTLLRFTSGMTGQMKTPSEHCKMGGKVSC